MNEIQTAEAVVSGEQLIARALGPNGSGMASRERFLNACRCRPVDKTPIWLMRQAGRALPEYRALKEKYSFVQLVQTPELAAEVTLQPIRRFKFDAAILFSDILVVNEAMGQSYDFKDGKGIRMSFLVERKEDFARIQGSRIEEKLGYVREAIRLIKPELKGETALIGFAGSPWTLANFMIEGAGVGAYGKAKGLLYGEPEFFNALLGEITRAVTDYLRMQIEAGVDAIQIFDSLGGELSDGSFEAGSGRWIQEIIAAVAGKVPVILFSKGTHGNWDWLAKSGAQVVGVDWNARLSEVHARMGGTVAVQGNMDPFLLTTSIGAVQAEARRILEEMRGRVGHIFNLGHGVPPGAKLENLATLVETVREFR